MYQNIIVSKKPSFEKISPSFGSSILVKQHQKEVINKMAHWHFHPEVELVYVNRGQGKRHIGNHLSYFNNSMLVLIGANLPHNGFVDRLTTTGKETIVQFKPDFWGSHFFNMPEMNQINLLFERAEKGILFQPETKSKVGPKIENMLECEGMSRVIILLDILNDLSQATDYTLLNADGFAFETELKDSERIDLIFKHVNQNFKNSISLTEMADIVSMTVPAFCRYFKKSTGKTFTKLVNEYRVVHATKLLQENQTSITDICYESGFNNFSHFNKLFKEFTGKSASSYRKEMKKMIKTV